MSNKTIDNFNHLRNLLKKTHMILKSFGIKALFVETNNFMIHKFKFIQLANLFTYRYFKVPLPKNLVIDPINTCNLRCPLCPTGEGILKYDKTLMPFETFKIIIDKFPVIYDIHLYNWGEPFLNPDLLAMVRYAKERSIRITIDSNFSLSKSDEFFIDIIQSGLDYLRISIDGASQSTYSKYRIGGNFNLIIDNIKKLVAFKNTLKKENPKIIWKFIVNKHNQDEIEKARDLAYDLGVIFNIVPIGLSDDLPDVIMSENIDQRMQFWLPKDNKYILEYYKKDYAKPLNNRPCFYLFQKIYINPDGKVFPCCLTTNQDNVFGDLLKDSIYDVWYNEHYKFSRSLFTGNKYLGSITKTICSKCDNFNKIAHRFNNDKNCL